MTTKTEPTPDATDLAVKEKSTPPEVLIGTHGIVLRSIDELWRFAQFVTSSDLATKGDTTATVLVKIQMGAEVGLPPMASIQNISVINGRPSIWGDAMLALCRASGLFDEAVFEETLKGSGMNMAATCTVRRLPNGKPITHTFSMEDAKLARLLDKDTPWRTYPRRMCQMRARSWALRDAFTDCLRGMRAVEEERDCITTTFAEQTEAKQVPAKTLDDLTEQMGKADQPPDPPKKMRHKNFAKRPDIQQTHQADGSVAADDPPPNPPTEADPRFTPPTEEEVASDQAQLADEFAGELAKAETASRVAELARGIGLAVQAYTLSAKQGLHLHELIMAAQERLCEVKG